MTVCIVLQSFVLIGSLCVCFTLLAAIGISAGPIIVATINTADTRSQDAIGESKRINELTSNISRRSMSSLQHEAGTISEIQTEMILKQTIDDVQQSFITSWYRRYKTYGEFLEFRNITIDTFDETLEALRYFSLLPGEAGMSCVTSGHDSRDPPLDIHRYALIADINACIMAHPLLQVAGWLLPGQAFYFGYFHKKKWNDTALAYLYGANYSAQMRNPLKVSYLYVNSTHKAFASATPITWTDSTAQPGQRALFAVDNPDVELVAAPVTVTLPDLTPVGLACPEHSDFAQACFGDPTGGIGAREPPYEAFDSDPSKRADFILQTRPEPFPMTLVWFHAFSFREKANLDMVRGRASTIVALADLKRYLVAATDAVGITSMAAIFGSSGAITCASHGAFEIELKDPTSVLTLKATMTIEYKSKDMDPRFIALAAYLHLNYGGTYAITELENRSQSVKRICLPGPAILAADALEVNKPITNQAMDNTLSDYSCADNDTHPNDTIVLLSVYRFGNRYGLGVGDLDKVSLTNYTALIGAPGKWQNDTAYLALMINRVELYPIIEVSKIANENLDQAVEVLKQAEVTATDDVKKAQQAIVRLLIIIVVVIVVMSVIVATVSFIFAVRPLRDATDCVAFVEILDLEVAADLLAAMGSIFKEFLMLKQGLSLMVCRLGEYRQYLPAWVLQDTAEEENIEPAARRSSRAQRISVVRRASVLGLETSAAAKMSARKTNSARGSVESSRTARAAPVAQPHTVPSMNAGLHTKRISVMTVMITFQEETGQFAFQDEAGKGPDKVIESAVAEQPAHAQAVRRSRSSSRASSHADDVIPVRLVDVHVPQEFVDKMNQVLTIIEAAIQPHKGVMEPDQFSYSKCHLTVTVVFNAQLRCGLFASAALDSALSIRENLRKAKLRCSAAIGVESANSICGSIGNTRQRWFVVVGDATTTSRALAAYAAKMHFPIVCADGTMKTLEQEQATFLHAHVDVLTIRQASNAIESKSVAKLSTAVQQIISPRFIAGRFEQDSDEWMYMLEQAEHRHADDSVESLSCQFLDLRMTRKANLETQAAIANLKEKLEKLTLSDADAVAFGTALARILYLMDASMDMCLSSPNNQSHALAATCTVDLYSFTEADHDDYS